MSSILGYDIDNVAVVVKYVAVCSKYIDGVMEVISYEMKLLDDYDEFIST